MRPTLFAIFDNVRDELTLVAPVYPRAGVAAPAAWEAAQARLDEAEAALDRPLPHAAAAGRAAAAAGAGVQLHQGRASSPRSSGARSTSPPATCFQVVPSQRFSAPVRAAAVRALPRAAADQSGAVPVLPRFRRLRRGRQLSPEILVRLRDGTVTIRPLAGTRPRGATPRGGPGAGGRAARRPEGARRAPDAARPRPQRRRPRRGDRHACKVTESFADRAVQPRHAHRLQRARASCAPGWTRSTRWSAASRPARCPARRRCGRWRSSRSSSRTRRGIYAGCIGYFAANGTMDTCIGLRTALVKDGMMYVQAGGGVVADCTPEGEYEETRPEGPRAVPRRRGGGAVRGAEASAEQRPHPEAASLVRPTTTPGEG